MWRFQEALKELLGFGAVTLQPAAGSHGELTGIKVIRAHHRANNQPQRDLIITPSSSHGTNPASAAMASFRTLGHDNEVKTAPDGTIDLDDLERILKENEGKVAGIMITNPNTLGIFERNIKEVCRLVHEAGGLVYMDGANLNAIVGRAKPGDWGVDVIHINLHKTFGTPHGGGGPGSGPVCVRQDLEKFLPKPTVERTAEGAYYLDYGRPDSIGTMHAAFGNVAVVVKAYTELRALGLEGLRRVSGQAVINANYMAARIAKRKDLFEIPYGAGMHEFVAAPAKRIGGEKQTLNIAKRLIDCSVHPPTIFFPLIVHGALMVEPTETAYKAWMDKFCDALIEAGELAASEDPAEQAKLKDAPVPRPGGVPVGRLDEAAASRDLNRLRELNISDIPGVKRILELVPEDELAGQAVAATAPTVTAGLTPAIPAGYPVTAEAIESGHAAPPDVEALVDVKAPEGLVVSENGEEWHRKIGDTAIAEVGVTHYSTENLGEVVFLELPEIGAEVTEGKPYGTIESGKATADLVSPVTGVVIERNDNAMDNPESVNANPYDQWLIRVRLAETSAGAAGGQAEITVAVVNYFLAIQDTRDVLDDFVAGKGAAGDIEPSIVRAIVKYNRAIALLSKYTQLVAALAEVRADFEEECNAAKSQHKDAFDFNVELTDNSIDRFFQTAKLSDALLPEVAASAIGGRGFSSIGRPPKPGLGYDVSREVPSIKEELATCIYNMNVHPAPAEEKTAIAVTPGVITTGLPLLVSQIGLGNVPVISLTQEQMPILQGDSSKAAVGLLMEIAEDNGVHMLRVCVLEGEKLNISGEDTSGFLELIPVNPAKISDEIRDILYRFGIGFSQTLEALQAAQDALEAAKALASGA